METALKNNTDKKEIANIANEIRLQLNPHPAGQMELNVPTLSDGTKLFGMQHKYKETCLFSQVKVKHVMHIVVFVLDGHNLLEWMK